MTHVFGGRSEINTRRIARVRVIRKLLDTCALGAKKYKYTYFCTGLLSAVVVVFAFLQCPTKSKVARGNHCIVCVIDSSTTFLINKMQKIFDT